jgi:hypothetical protein
MTCSRIYIANSLVTGKENVLKRYFFTDVRRVFQPMHAICGSAVSNHLLI